ncbi:hypothetical protein AB4Y36_10225 [Paraburkholderia sp. BR10936]
MTDAQKREADAAAESAARIERAKAEFLRYLTGDWTTSKGGK